MLFVGCGMFYTRRKDERILEPRVLAKTMNDRSYYRFDVTLLKNDS